MKLPVTALDLSAQLAEFDVWITPSLGEVRDTVRFREQMAAVVSTFEALGKATNRFHDVADCRPAVIAETFVRLVRGRPEAEVCRTLEALASVLFLVTGRSDNNAKCQFPLYLRDHAHWPELPVVRKTRTGPELSAVRVPRELKAEKYLGIVANLGPFPEQQQRLLEQFVGFLLDNEACVSQLWSIGHSFFVLKHFGREQDLLAPLVIFQVRGSVAASGGHDPEELLRARLLEWGLEAGADFNTIDVVLGDLASLAATDPGRKSAVGRLPERIKTRAYDFVFPYRTPGWNPCVFVQAQFYAGDSGSVSHKNVDQTSTSRAAVRAVVPEARFVEYVDGAGYFSSLNGDLKTLLSSQTTASYFQVRSAAIRLRRELQQIGFLLPIDMEHAVLRAGGKRDKVRRLLVSEGYAPAEIKRAVESGLHRGLITAEAGGSLGVSRARRDLVRRYFLLDVAARCGAPATDSKLSGSLLVPGYGPFFGAKLDTLAEAALKLAPELVTDWARPTSVLGDIRWLCDQGLAMSSS
ncbi:MAG TPA: hypothetical protein VND64_10615 [Pirellulales bacterium]|nr:hypothetical protein [Pirellulales bacterium]